MLVQRTAVLLACALAAAACDPESASSDGGGVLLVAPVDPDLATARQLDAAAAYVEAIAGGPPRIARVTGAFDDVVDAARDRGAGLVLVLDAATVAADRFDADRLAELGEWGFALDVEDLGDWDNRLDSEGATFVLAAGTTPLSRQYAAYEALRRLGVRFFHPEQEYVPAHAAADLRDLARRPTVLHRDGQDYLPDFQWRSWSFHGAHPLEHLEAFSDSEHPIDEAAAVNDWIVKNFGNRFRGPGRGIASPQSQAQRAAELDELRRTLGFPRGAGVTLHNQQQGASADIDPTSSTPVQTQIETLVRQRIDGAPDARWFGIHFGPTEFTTTPDQETIDWIEWAGAEALRLRPDIDVEINNHITGDQPSPNYDDLGCDNGTGGGDRIDYYDLAFHTDPRLGVRVHTVMFYPLEGPARVYNQQSFAHKLCLMEQASAQGRPLGWFPEGSWWLSFDNTIPVYLPLHILTRHRDVELLSPLLPRNGGTLRDHRMFNSGHEWGYWQQDYAVGLLGFKADVTVAEILGEIFDPLCPPDAWRDGCAARDEAIAVLTELMEHQRAAFLDREDFDGRPGGLYAYFAGEDQADVIAADSGFEFRPVRVAFSDVARWDAEELAHFRDTDLAALDEAARAYDGWLSRLVAARNAAPQAGLPWIDEVIDGVEIDALRARHAHALYDAVLSYRQATLDEAADPAQAADAALARADEALAAAAVVIARREAAYRYPAAQEYGGGLTPETAVENGTTYPYRVHTKTHLLTYWTARHDDARAVIAGEDAGAKERVTMIDAIDLPGAPLAVTWPALADLGGSVTIGDAIEIDPSTSAVELGDAPSYWAVRGELTTEGRTIDVAGGVARSDVLARTPAQGLTLTEPDDPAAQSVLASVFPSLKWAYVDDPEALVLGADDDEDGTVSFERVVYAAVVASEDDGFSTAPVALSIPVSTSSATVEVGLSEVVLHGRVDAGVLADPVELTGRISVDDLVDALVELAAFDREGALMVLAGVLGFDASDPPETVAVAATLAIEH